MSFKNAVRFSQLKLARKQMLYDLPSFDESVSEKEKRENLVAHKKQLEEELLSYRKGSLERLFLGQKLQDVNTAINKIRPKLKINMELSLLFIEVARKRLTQAEFTIWFEEAAALANTKLDKDIK